MLDMSCGVVVWAVVVLCQGLFEDRAYWAGALQGARRL
jgi:hypothetical protein